MNIYFDNESKAFDLNTDIAVLDGFPSNLATYIVPTMLRATADKIEKDNHGSVPNPTDDGQPPLPGT